MALIDPSPFHTAPLSIRSMGKNVNVMLEYPITTLYAGTFVLNVTIISVSTW